MIPHSLPLPIHYFNCFMVPIYLNSNQKQQHLSFSTSQQTTQKIQIITKQTEPARPSHQPQQKSYRNKLQNFLSNTGGLLTKDLSIQYMKLSSEYSKFKIKQTGEFMKMYCRTVQKYEDYYEGERRKKSWGKYDVEILIWLIHRLAVYSVVNPKEWSCEEWKLISELIPFRNPDECKFKYLSIRKNQLKINPWDNEEIEILFSLIESDCASNSNVLKQTDIDWNLVCEQLFSRTKVYRTSKQCRECWNIQMKSHHESKKLWSKEEDEILVKRYKKEGRKWKSISEGLVGRSENAIKNRFNLLMSKGFVEGEEKQKEKEKCKGWENTHEEVESQIKLEPLNI